MNERESYLIFPKTEKAIKERVVILKEKAKKIGQSGVFGMDDGDAMDGNEMLRARVEISELNGEVARTNKLLAMSKVWDEEKVNEQVFDSVKLGSRVVAIVRYPDGERERLNFSVGSTLDADVRFHPQKPYGHGIISIETPFVQAILGAAKGDTRAYESKMGIVEVEVRRVSKSPYITGC
ncbi:hypothetical protein C4578_02445 [Candidatus Microgenomates bacterium]|jgi:transcription elongation GreA/GreB family factor|nr:MAG: hypothetical protein C4578_02445 [Candidatus Microgenomates bacterium]